jgi:methylenetetrahydrofolate dehydrogenase (NADP+) / methenyltetrahydrofolate cyclohydrolase
MIMGAASDLGPSGAAVESRSSAPTMVCLLGSVMSETLILAGDPAAEALLERAKRLMQTLAQAPKLVVVRIGEDPASIYYTRMKARRAKKIGMASALHELAADVDESTVLALIASLNADPSVSGILVQLPFPPGSAVGQARVLAAIDPAKDVDGLHVQNAGRLWSDQPGLLPCTPAGVMVLLDHYGLSVAGKRVVIVGRSVLVGRPLAALMLGRHATVTIAHSRTADLGAVTREADILVAAVGRPQMIRAAMVKPGAVVVDVGINRVTTSDGEGNETSHLVGDVHPEVAEVASAITPVPGGVGPMTVAHLLYNTVLAASALQAKPAHSA